MTVFRPPPKSIYAAYPLKGTCQKKQHRLVIVYDMIIKQNKHLPSSLPFTKTHFQTKLHDVTYHKHKNQKQFCGCLRHATKISTFAFVFLECLSSWNSGMRTRMRNRPKDDVIGSNKSFGSNFNFSFLIMGWGVFVVNSMGLKRKMKQGVIFLA